MQIDIPKDEAHRVIEFLTLTAHQFPEMTRGLLEVSHEAKNGITIEIRPFVHGQTSPQRGYYHKWKNEFAEHCGMTPDEMHEEILCQAYGSEVHETRMGRRIRPVKRSSQANRVEYSVLIDTLIRVAANMDFIVPPPQREADEFFTTTGE